MPAVHGIPVFLCFHSAQAPGQENIYLVGTEEGSIHTCSKAYGSDYLGTYTGHGMPVYAVKWNSIHPGTFLSCSADWSVKVRLLCAYGGCWLLAAFVAVGAVVAKALCCQQAEPERSDL